MSRADCPTEKRLPRFLVEVRGQEPSLMPAGRTLLLDRFLKRALGRWELTYGHITELLGPVGIVLTTTVSPVEWRMAAEVLPIDELPAPRSILDGDASCRVEVLIARDLSSFYQRPSPVATRS